MCVAWASGYDVLGGLEEFSALAVVRGRIVLNKGGHYVERCRIVTIVRKRAGVHEEWD